MEMAGNFGLTPEAAPQQTLFLRLTNSTFGIFFIVSMTELY